MTPPRTRRDAVVETLHGVAVADPYRWLEEGDDPEVQHWVAEQNRHTRSALDAIPDRGLWHERLVALMGLPVVQSVQVRGDRLILLEREAGAQQARLVVRSLSDPDRAPTVLADPAAAATDAASAVDWFFTSPDGSLVAFGVSEGGTEDSVLRVVRTDDATLLDEEIPNCRACSVGWEPDGCRLLLHPIPGGRRVPPHRASPHARRSSGATIRWCGPSSRRPRRGRTSVSPRRVATCWWKRSWDGVAPTCTCSTASTARGATSSPVSTSSTSTSRSPTSTR